MHQAHATNPNPINKKDADKTCDPIIDQSTIHYHLALVQAEKDPEYYSAVGKAIKYYLSTQDSIQEDQKKKIQKTIKKFKKGNPTTSLVALINLKIEKTTPDSLLEIIEKAEKNFLTHYEQNKTYNHTNNNTNNNTYRFPHY